MNQAVKGRHKVDEAGNPAGGRTVGLGLRINWQNGPLAVDGQRVEPSGAFVEGVINAAIDRLNCYQQSKFACPENARALSHLHSAIACLMERTQDRERRQVEGTHKV